MRLVFFLVSSVYGLGLTVKSGNGLSADTRTLPPSGTSFGGQNRRPGLTEKSGTAPKQVPATGQYVYVLFGFRLSNDENEFYKLPCNSKDANALELALCNILDASKKCGGIDPVTETLISPEKLCDPDCKDHISTIFEAQANTELADSPSSKLSHYQTEILSSIVNTISRAYCENCRKLCWQLNCGFF